MGLWASISRRQGEASPMQASERQETITPIKKNSLGLVILSATAWRKSDNYPSEYSITI